MTYTTRSMRPSGDPATFVHLPESDFRKFVQLVHVAKALGMFLRRPLHDDPVFRLGGARGRTILATPDLEIIEQRLDAEHRRR